MEKAKAKARHIVVQRLSTGERVVIELDKIEAKPVPLSKDYDPNKLS